MTTIGGAFSVMSGIDMEFTKSTPTTAPQPPFRFSLWGMLRVVAGISILLGMFDCTFRKPVRDLKQRHLEVTQFIEDMYAAYQRDGRCPITDEYDGWAKRLPPGCTLYIHPNWPVPPGPTLCIMGVLHQGIRYEFISPVRGQISRTWTYNDEGYETPFEAEVTYSPAHP